MNQHPGGTFILSTLIVAAFTVAFYRPDPPARVVAASPPPRAVAADGPGKVASRVGSEAGPTPARSKQPSTDARVVQAGTVATAKIERPRGPAPVEPTGRLVSRPVRSWPPGPGSAFTVAEEGETLADVAARVYGPGASADGLWRANRDSLPTPEAPLRRGMSLRTP